MSDEELNAIKARADAATKGPWEGEPPGACVSRANYKGALIADCWCDALGGFNKEREHNAVFIAHARTDVPLLVAEVRRLQKLVAKKGAR